MSKEDDMAGKVVDLYAMDSVQFPRLLAEINAMGLDDEQYRWLEESMNLSRREIDGLLARAEIEWERLKAKHCPPRC